MKVQNIKQHDFGLPTTRSALHTDTEMDRAVSFKSTLTNLSNEQFSLHMSELVAKIDMQAEKLKNRTDIKEFQRYRQLIKEFLDEIVSNGYEFSKDTTFGTRGRHRFFATVKIIDEKLDEMAKAVLGEQADGIETLHRIDDIRGLLLDLML